ncbi:MAG TPA: hypothetical protein VF997_20895, partial [Polyangia bacterium]
MLALPLLVTTLALAPTGGSSRFELGLGAEVDTTSTTVPQAHDEDSLSAGGQGGAGLTVFGRRVVDDDAPPALQPYLQRAAQLHVDGGGGGATFSRVATSQLPGNDRTIGWAGVDASGYADRFYGYLGLGVRYLSQSSGTFTSLTLPIDLAAGVRFGDARVLLGWSVAPTRYGNDVFRVPFWGGVYARAYGVV